MNRERYEAEEAQVDARYLVHLDRADAIEEEARTHRILSRPRREGIRKARQYRDNAQRAWGLSMDRLWRLATDRRTDDRKSHAGEDA